MLLPSTMPIRDAEEQERGAATEDADDFLLVTSLQKMAFQDQRIQNVSSSFRENVTPHDLDESSSFCCNSDDEAEQLEAGDTFTLNPLAAGTKRYRTYSSDWLLPMHSTHANLAFPENYISIEGNESEIEDEYDVESSAIGYWTGGLEDLENECKSLASSISSLSTLSIASRSTIFSQEKYDPGDNVSGENLWATFRMRDRTYITSKPTHIDILLGRGGNINNHPGNLRYLEEIKKRKPEYFRSTKLRKFEISNEILSQIHSYGGRFLVRDKDKFFIADDKRARKKISQALREGQMGMKWRENKARRATRKEEIKAKRATIKQAHMNKRLKFADQPIA